MKRVIKQETSPHFLAPWHTWLIFAVYLILTLLFFYMLGQKTKADFGFLEIIFSLGVAWLLTLIMGWIRTLVLSNPYLGLGIGVLTIIAFASAIFARYQGPYTLSFVTIGSLTTAIYLVIFFFIAKNRAGK